MDFAFKIVSLLLVLLWFVYKKLTAKFNTFRERGVRYDKPILFFGNLFEAITGRKSFFDVLGRLYEKFYNEKVFGIFMFGNPGFVVKDAEILKQIFIKDFDSFFNHDTLVDESVDKISGRNLFFMADEKWKIMRNNLTPLFTSSKMKMMFEKVSECAQDFINHFEKQSLKGEVNIDAKDAFARFTVDGICTAALGFKGDCIENEHSPLMEIATSISTPTFGTTMKLFLLTISKSLYVLFRLQFTSQEVRDFLYRVIIEGMREREKKGFVRPDIIQLLLQIKNGKEKNLKPKEENMSWTEEDYMAQGFIFFAGGFETTKNLLQTCSYELAMNPEIQQQLIDEVDEVITSMNGKEISYEVLHKMKFLDKVISESLRYWPPVGLTNRECTKNYSMDLGSGKKLEIKSGDQISIPVFLIHRDPKYFDNPNMFDPSRFDDDRKHSIVTGSYIPFGSGPRVCIGSRFALMEAKLLIFKILSKFTIEKCDKTPKKLEYASKFGTFEFKEKIYVKLKSRM